MDNKVHNQIVSFTWGIADDVLRDVIVREKYRVLFKEGICVKKKYHFKTKFTYLADSIHDYLIVNEKLDEREESALQARK